MLEVVFPYTEFELVHEIRREHRKEVEAEEKKPKRECILQYQRIVSSILINWRKATYMNR